MGHPGMVIFAPPPKKRRLFFLGKEEIGGGEMENNKWLFAKAEEGCSPDKNGFHVGKYASLVDTITCLMVGYVFP